ncbi:MAG TPA: PLP-dependent aminotransferase family protein [Symbiobacteriaceae bacterium]|jgi:2-aminoadipate transaminase
MEADRYFPPAVRAALAYDPPGAWMPPLPSGCIRLSAGYPFKASVPSVELARATAALVAAEADLPFHYLGSPAMGRLPALLAARSVLRGMAAGPGELMVTAGAAQALDLAARAVLGPADVVAVEAPTYMEALEIFRNYTPLILGYPVDGEGLQVAALASDLADRRAKGLPTPKLLYTIASFQNPTGATLSLVRRRRLLELAREYDFLILEDDAYGELAFGDVPTPIKALDTDGRVIYVGSLSKVIAPGLRIGWVHAAPGLVAAMSNFKKDLDQPFGQAVTATYLASVDLSARVDELRRAYRERRDVMLAALAQHMPAGVTWTRPEGGFFLWLHAPGVDTGALLAQALAAGVAYVPGKHFYFGANVGGREFLRLSFCYLPEEQMIDGVARLGRLLAAPGSDR